MAKRTEERQPGVEVPAEAPVHPQGPFWLGWGALALALAVGIGLVAYMSVHATHAPRPAPAGSQAPPAASSAPALGPGVPATTYADFAALPPIQQRAVMQQAIDHYGAVLADAIRRLDPSRLPQVATGAQLQVLQQTLQGAIDRHQPQDVQNQDTILRIVMSPQPYSFVSVDGQGTEIDQALDPKTLQPIGSPTTTTAHSSLSFVIEEGVWKVSEHIDEQPAS